ncbi:alpha/beta hydrolase [Priestia endophytica]|uniref:alpha/beta hydrolase n=1 Tax=Priestia endophytica TaxID=135735 RepID=UPI003D2C81E0
MQNNKKKSSHLLDPDLKAFTESMLTTVLTSETLEQTRKHSENMIPSLPENLPIELSERFIPGKPGDPDVRVLVFTPENHSSLRPGYLHIHGGGMVYGKPDLNIPENAKLALELDCIVVSVDYRLAPETPYPGPIEDCYAALKWMHDYASELGMDNSKIAIGGESAGGGLAASLAVLARDRNEVNIIFQRLIIPMLDDRTCIAEDHPYNGEYAWTSKDNRFGWKALLGHEPGIEGVSPYASAPREENLSGLPPAFICVGAIELFLEESLEYAKHLIRAGVPTELHVYPGAHHLALAVSEARVTKSANKDMFKALYRAFYG